MAFICKDCGNKSTRKFPGGKCPACESYNIRNTSSTREAIREKQPKTLMEILILCVVWILFIYGAWDRYLRPETDMATPDAIKAQSSTSRMADEDLGY